MRVICNIRVEYRGLEKIPKGPLIVASKHQSMWETFALLQFFDQPLFILKRELTLDSVFRLVPDEGEHDRDRPRRRRPRAAADGAPRRRGGPARPSADHLSGRHAHAPVGAPPRLQDRHRPDLCRLRRDLPAGGAQFRAVLAAPDLHALSGHAGGRISRSAAAGPAAPRIHRAHLDRDRGRHQPPGRGRARRAGATVRPRAETGSARR